MSYTKIDWVSVPAALLLYEEEIPEKILAVATLPPSSPLKCGDSYLLPPI